MENNLNNLIDKLVPKLDIVNIISNFIPLEKKGVNFWGLCPFHNDTKPSFSVSVEKGIYKCFSCGKGGNAINFYQNIKGIKYIDALKELSDKTEINWRDYLSEKKIFVDERSELIKKINKEAMLFYKFNLKNLIKEENEIKRYISKRNISLNEIDNFSLGFAKKNNELKTFLIEKGFKEEEILKTGLITLNGENLNDFFKNRLIFPIINENNDVVGFSGRIINDNDKKYSKYLNSKENHVFKKNEIIYNLNNAKNKIIQEDKIIITEGFMDVISLSKKNIYNVVAVMGTNFSEKHINKIKGYTKKILLAFDNDEAGRKTTSSLLKKLINKNLKIEILNIENYKDLDELVNNYEKSVEDYIKKNTFNFIEFFLKKFKNNTKEINEEKVKSLYSIIKLETNSFKKIKYEKELKDFLNKNFGIEEKQFSKIVKNNISINNAKESTKINEIRNLKEKQNIYEIQIIDFAYFINKESKKILDENFFIFKNKLNREITRKLDNYSKGEVIEDEEIKEFISKIYFFKDNIDLFEIKNIKMLKQIMKKHEEIQKKINIKWHYSLIVNEEDQYGEDDESIINRQKENFKHIDLIKKNLKK